MLYRDLLNFMRNLLLIAGGANEVDARRRRPRIWPRSATVAEKFSYTDLLRIANLLLRDDETVNRAEHQRLAVEIALLKAATFPRLKSGGAGARGGAQRSPHAAAPSASRSARNRAPRRRQHAGEADHASLPRASAGDRSSSASRRRGRSSAAISTRAKRAKRDGNRITVHIRRFIHRRQRQRCEGRTSSRSPPRCSASR